jgi:putative transcriptional regulator
VPLQSLLVTLPSLLDTADRVPDDVSDRRRSGRTLMDARLLNCLKVARAEAALSQSDLAAVVGVTRQTISSIETGQYCPSTLLTFLIARALHKQIEQLFMLEGDAQ